VLFDMDGTLVDSLPGIAKSFTHALAAAGVKPAVGVHRLRSLSGPPIRESLRRHGVPDSLIDTSYAAYRERYDAVGWRECAPFDGMIPLLYSLKAQGVRVGIATSKAAENAERIVDMLGIGSLLSVVCGGTWGQPRSKGEIITAALTQFGGDEGIDPRSVMMVGDTGYDVRGAHAAGIDVCAVTWGYGSRAELSEADWVVDVIRELRDQLIRGD
jgi:phosphoglycolate phosphatase